MLRKVTSFHQKTTNYIAINHNKIRLQRSAWSLVDNCKKILKKKRKLQQRAQMYPTFVFTFQQVIKMNKKRQYGYPCLDKNAKGQFPPTKISYQLKLECW